MNYKIREVNPILMSQYNAVLQLATTDTTNVVKEKINQFESVSNIQEAKSLFRKLFPNQEGKQSFFIDGVEINVLDKEDLFKISADTTDDYILYVYNN